MEHDGVVIPEELVSEILLRLPARCVWRLKIVCKSWWSTINSPCFIAQHLLLQNDTDLYLLVSSTTVPLGSKTIHRLPYDTLGAVLEPTTYCPPIHPQLGKLDIVSCCNGLILFSDIIQTKWFLWNPTTGQTKLLPSSPSRASKLKESDPKIYYYNAGFGFDTKTMDYKVALMYKLRSSFVAMLVELYSLKTNSWTTITTFPDKVLLYGSSNNGMLSWIGRYKVDGEAKDTILSIDLSSETIITTLCPRSTSSTYTTPLVYKESLALVYCYIDTRNRSFDIWVLGEYGVKESWNKLFTIGPLQGINRVLGFWKDAGKVFVEKFLPNPLQKELLLLDIATQQTTSLQISGGCKTLFTYRESLVPLES